MFPVTDDLAHRGRILVRRRLQHGLHHTDVAAATGLGRKTVARAETGHASEDSVRKLEIHFDQLDAEKGIDTTESTAPAEPEIITFRVTGPRTEFSFEVSGPVEDVDVVRQQTMELWRELREDD